MNTVDFCLKFVLFYIFFGLWSAPLVFIFMITPSTPGLLYWIDTLAALGFVVWMLVFASWLARHAALRSTYDYASPIDSMFYAVDRGRVLLSFLPVIGPTLAPRRPRGEADPLHPR